RVFFFLMLRRPPRSTLFPTRRSSDLADVTGRLDNAARDVATRNAEIDSSRQIGRAHVELQSPMYLVCRLLLEKKKNKNSSQTAKASKQTLTGHDGVLSSGQ